MPRPRKQPAPADPAAPPAEPKWAGDSFADVKRACHRFLLSRDPAYARQVAANQASPRRHALP